jgi:hypothetical protein
MCLDQVQKDKAGNDISLKELELYGNERINQAKLDFLFKPCHPVKWTQEREDKGERCLVKVESDEDMLAGSELMNNRLIETEKYLRTCMFYAYHNEERINYNNYGENSLVKSSLYRS